MPHRGRLNLLTELLNFSPTALFHKIKGGSEIPEELGAEGDVISHLGKLSLSVVVILVVGQSGPDVCPSSETFLAVASPTLNYDGVQNPIKISLLPNPSHLGMYSSRIYY
jgi:probable 2-oxoglutarate dehydrogenase E1 component DHKTD1